MSHATHHTGCPGLTADSDIDPVFDQTKDNDPIDTTPTSTHAPMVLPMPPLDAVNTRPKPIAPPHNAGNTANPPSKEPHSVAGNAAAGKSESATARRREDQAKLPVRDQVLPVLDLPDIGVADQLARLVWRDLFPCRIPGLKEGATLTHWHNGWHLWDDGYYRQWTDADFRNWMTGHVNDYFERDYQSRLEDYDARMASEREKKKKNPSEQTNTKGKRIAALEKKEEAPPKRSNVGVGTINNMLQSLAGLPAVRFPEAQCDRQPAWRGDSGGHDAKSMVVFKNGMVDVDDLIAGRGNLLPLSPNLFSSISLDFDYSETPLQCPEWLVFLHESLNGEADSIALLQEFMGLCLTADNSFQKMLILIGAPGSGKGTIINVIHALVGDKNYAGVKLRSLAKNFALAPLSGKAVACDPDVRLGVKDRDAILDLLLSITGDNPLSVEKKYKDAVNERLVSRFVLGMNEMPDFGDSSGAMKRRVLMLRFPKSFQDKADLNLPKKLKSEYPAILQWCLEGLKRLHRNKNEGRSNPFTTSESGSAYMEEVVERNLVDDFADDHVETSPGNVERKDVIDQELADWCERRGKEVPNDSWFWKKMRSKFPAMVTTKKGPKKCRVRLVEGIRLVPLGPDIDPRDWLGNYLKEKGVPVHKDQIIADAQFVGIDADTLDMVARATDVMGDAGGDHWSSPRSFHWEEDRGICIGESPVEPSPVDSDATRTPPF